MEHILRRPLQESCGGRHLRHICGRRLCTPSFRRFPGPGNGMDGCFGLWLPALLRFLRIFGYGRWSGEAVWNPFPCKFQLTLQIDWHYRVLATMAYFAIEIFTGLSVFSAGRKSPRHIPSLHQCDDSYGSRRTLAWSELDISGMGRNSWSYADRQSRLAELRVSQATVFNTRIIRAAFVGLTFLVVTLAWIPFRSGTLHEAWRMFQSLFEIPPDWNSAQALLVQIYGLRAAVLWLAIVVLATWILPNSYQIFMRFNPVNNLSSEQLSGTWAIEKFDWRVAWIFQECSWYRFCISHT